MSVVNHISYDFPVDLTRFPESDGVPLETVWHWFAMHVLVESTCQHFHGRRRFFCCGNNFIYWNENDPRKVVGPDYYLVFGCRDVPPDARPMWCVWVEGGLFPSLIIELTSATTARLDRTTKKKLYEKTFCTDEYMIYDHRTQKLQGWRLIDGEYVSLEPDQRGWLWSRQHGAWVGTWEGKIKSAGYGVWLRFYDKQGRVLPLAAEKATAKAELARKRAGKERQRANEQEAQAREQRARAEAAEAEVARLRSLLGKQQKTNGKNGAKGRRKD
jgi:Uma2 family endonuclease